MTRRKGFNDHRISWVDALHVASLADILPKLPTDGFAEMFADFPAKFFSETVRNRGFRYLNVLPSFYTVFSKF